MQSESCKPEKPQHTSDAVSVRFGATSDTLTVKHPLAELDTGGLTLYKSTLAVAHGRKERGLHPIVAERRSEEPMKYTGERHRGQESKWCRYP